MSDGYDDDDCDIFDNLDNCASCDIPGVYDALDVSHVTDDSDVCSVNDILEHCIGKKVMPTMVKISLIIAMSEMSMTTARDCKR